MQRTILSIAFAAVSLLCAGASLATTAPYNLDDPNGTAATSPAVQHEAHGPLSWYMCVGTLKLCGPRHIQCGKYNHR